MKLISCYIESFGALQQFEYRFSEELELVHRENGTGKTTLSAFILAMLYGMETTKKTDKEQKIRERYDPWAGGRYGGCLSLQVQGKTYRIERFFDSTTATKDKITVYDEANGEEINLTVEPGAHFLGISKEAFLATAFLSGKEQGQISAILPRLHGYLEGIEGTDTYDHALKLLSNASKEYTKRSTGKIDLLKKQIKDTQACLTWCRQASDNAEYHQQALSLIEKEILPKRKRFKFLTDYATIIERQAVLKDYEQKHLLAKKELEEFISLHGALFPTEQELARLEKQLNHVKEQFHKATATQKDIEEETQMKQLDTLYASLSEQQITEAGEKITLLTTLEDKIQQAVNFGKSEEYTVLHQKFDGDLPSDKEMELLQKINIDLENEALLYEHIKAQNAKKAKSLKTRFPVLLVLTALCSVLSVGAFAIHWVFGVVVLLLCILCGISAVTALILSKNLAKEKRQPEHIKQRNHLMERLSALGYATENLSLSLSLLAEDRKFYLSLCKKEKQLQAQIDDLKAEAEGAGKALDLFFAPFGYTDQEYGTKLDSLKKEYALYTLRSAQMAQRIKDRADAKELARTGTLELTAQLCRYFPNRPEQADAEELLGSLKVLSRSFSLLETACRSRAEDLEHYQAQTDLALPEGEEVPSPGEREQLEEELTALEKEASSRRLKLEEELEKASELPDVEALLSHLQEQTTVLNDRKRILELTAGYLKEAHDDLSSRYTLPIRRAYEEYALQIDPSLCAGLTVSPVDMSLQFERNGALRKNENFNSAFLVLSNICMRLALLKVAYPNERPFLVLDDPFVYLDDDNCKKALEALKKLSSDTQILYFTCHSGRTI